jgi:hypothetical protein
MHLYWTLHIMQLYWTLRTVQLYWTLHIMQPYWIQHTMQLYWTLHTMQLYWTLHTMQLYWTLHTMQLYWALHTINYTERYTPCNYTEPYTPCNYIELYTLCNYTEPYTPWNYTEPYTPCNCTEASTMYMYSYIYIVATILKLRRAIPLLEPLQYLWKNCGWYWGLSHAIFTQLNIDIVQQPACFVYQYFLPFCSSILAAKIPRRVSVTKELSSGVKCKGRLRYYGCFSSQLLYHQLRLSILLAHQVVLFSIHKKINIVSNIYWFVSVI